MSVTVTVGPSAAPVSVVMSLVSPASSAGSLADALALSEAGSLADALALSEAGSLPLADALSESLAGALAESLPASDAASSLPHALATRATTANAATQFRVLDFVFTGGQLTTSPLRSQPNVEQSSVTISPPVR
ncbi:MAG: hypothetical protein AAGG08_01660 [Actinomycetota bacterium]